MCKDINGIKYAGRYLGVRWHGDHPMEHPGKFHHRETGAASGAWDKRNWADRAFTVGIGGPVGSGKTALCLKLAEALRDRVPLGCVTNDIFTQEDAEFLVRNDALPSNRIVPIETGGCPHAAIREDVSSNLTALEGLTAVVLDGRERPLLLCESGGDNLAANFSRELADFTIYVIDVAGGDKVPRKGGPGITQSDVLVVNKTDLAEAVGADLGVMERDAAKMRDAGAGPTIFASIKHGDGVDDIIEHIMTSFQSATGATYAYKT